MAVLYSYPIKSTPANRDDLVVISDSRDGNKTKQIAVANLPGSASFSGIGGSGTVNYIPKFSTSTDLVDSIVYESSSKIGIGTTSPVKTLDVNGDVTFGTGNKFQTITNALEGVGENGVYLRSAISSAANPSFSNSDDKNTGMFLPGSDVLGLSTAGLERFRITSSGNVGIGTVSPSADGLQIANKSSVNAGNTQLFITGNSSGQSLLGLGDNNNNYTQHIASNHADNSMRFYTNSSYPGNNERLRITSTGNVGIGTTSPSEKLEVVGDIKVNDSLNPNIRFARGASYWWDIGHTASNFQLESATGGVIMHLNYDGNVGIGTTAPSDGDLTIGTPKLHVAVGGTSGTFNLAARFQSTTTDLDNTGTSILINSSNDRGLLIKAGRKDGDREVAYFDVVSSAGNTTNMLTMGKFASAYNLGIGTTVPQEKLHIQNGAIRVNGQGADQLQLYRNASTQSNFIKFFDAENAGSNEAYVGYTSNNKDLKFQNLDAAGTISLVSGSTTTLRVTSAGDIGIGTTSPSNKLTVGTLGGETSIASASTGFESLRLGTLTFPAAAGWYRVASYSVAGARGGARIDLCMTGGAFSPVTYSIDYFKFYTQTGTEHTLKLEQYGGAVFITKARIAFNGANTYIEVYKIATTSQGTMPAQVHFNRLIGESGGSLPMFGTATSGAGSTSLKEVEFIAQGTSVEALQVQGGNLNLKNLPTSASGLTAGDIYNDGGTLKIVP